MTKIAVALFGTRSHYAPPHVAHGAKVRVLRGVNKCPPREAMSDAVLRRVLGKKPRDTRSGEPWVCGNAAAMRQLSLTAALLAVALVLRVEPARADLDWHALGEEAATLLSDLIRVDTTNPPGGETAAANLLARKFRAEGIETEVMESAPGRGNLYARLPGQGGARPLILLSHLDVVPADPRDWRIAPFGGIRERGHIYGRGALDAKGLSVIQAMAVIALKRSHRPPGRDVIVLATADEETGGAAGAGWLVHHRRELLGNAEYLLTEGDHIHLRGGRKIVQVSVAEKTPCWVKLVAHGESGHGSTPPRFTAVTRLIRALNKIRRYRTPISLVPAVESYFAAFAPLEKEPLRGALTHLHDALEEPQFLADFTRNPRQNALIRDTITPSGRAVDGRQISRFHCPASQRDRRRRRRRRDTSLLSGFILRPELPSHHGGPPAGGSRPRWCAGGPECHSGIHRQPLLPRARSRQLRLHPVRSHRGGGEDGPRQQRAGLRSKPGKRRSAPGHVASHAAVCGAEVSSFVLTSCNSPRPLL